jgi:hypothetical protein
MTQKERTAHWSAIVERQIASGMSGLAWCQMHQINTASFYSWRRKLSEPQGQQGFIELASSTAEYAGIRICMGPLLSIEVERGFDPVTLRTVIETLHNGFPCSA